MFGIVMVLLVAAMIVGRMFVPGHGLTWAGTYEAFAHILCGALIALCFLSPDGAYYFAMLIVASVFELIMFLLRSKL